MDYNKIIIALVIVIVVMLAAGFLFLNPSHAKVDSRVIVTSNSALHEGDTFAIKLTDLNNTPIANQIVNITIIDVNGGKNPKTVTTDANGEEGKHEHHHQGDKDTGSDGADHRSACAETRRIHPDRQSGGSMLQRLHEETA